jgi:hypothetical protein
MPFKDITKYRVLKPILIYLLIAVVSCTNQKNAIRNDVKTYKPRILGSVIRFQDTDGIKMILIRVNSPIPQLDSIRDSYYKTGPSGKSAYYKQLGTFYNFDKVYPKELIDTYSLIVPYFYKLKDSTASEEVIENILKDSAVIVSNLEFIFSSEVVWYCINGFYPMEGCYEGPIIFVNYRKEMGITGYKFKIN